MLTNQTVDECIDAYLDLSKEVFKVDKVLAGCIPAGDDRCRFDYNILEAVIKKIIREKLGDENRHMNAIPNTSSKNCPTFVIAKTAANINGPPTIFRTYRGEKIWPSECALWQAARATSAAPTFFKPMSVDCPRPPITYVDGGMGCNNPSDVALNEAQRIWPTCTQFGLVSIGTGRSKANSLQFSDAAEANPDSLRSLFDDIKSYIPNVVIGGWNTAKNLPPGVKALIEMASALAKLATNSEDVHQRVARDPRSNPKEKRLWYFRFNVPRDVGDIGLGDWTKANDLAAHTKNYMEEHETEERRDLCVKFLLSTASSLALGVNDDPKLVVSSQFSGNSSIY
jgi:Patatin-like phospholipase